MELEPLEYAKLLNRLADYTLFSASQQLALALKPTPYYTEACDRQADTSEAVRLLTLKDNVSIGGARDVRPLAARAGRGATLQAEDLLQVRQTLIAARDLQRILLRLEDAYPRLADMAQRIAPCGGVVNEIGNVIDERAEVKNNASPALNRIRRELDTVHGRLLEKLNRLVASPNYTRFLQETLVTQRGGRYVVPVKAEFKGRVQGIVHDQSSSGATIFVEPLATVEMNNKWRQLQLDEAEEVRRILAEVSALVASHAKEIAHTVEALADLDLTFAKAKYATATESSPPTMYDLASRQHCGPLSAELTAESLAFQLPAARHPLIEPEEVVPIDLALNPETNILVITGPNTGGKTVSLKTIGLLAAMAQAGLWLPTAEGALLPVFNQIFADIGDEQSIEQSLSTFSGHMKNIVHILTNCDERSLVIFDELGAGTDPIEGSALAQSILSNLLNRHVTTLVATHYPELKAYAHATEGVLNASMEFDLETLSPTYRLLIGLPGSSNAFTIAHRLGLSDDVIDQARGLVDEDSKKVEAMLAQIQEETEAAAKLRRAVELERATVEKQEAELTQQFEEIEAEKRDILNSARADARREIKAARQQIRALQEEAEALRRSMAAQATAEEAEELEEQLETLDSEIEARQRKPQPKPKPKPTPPPSPGRIKPGDTVFVAQYNTKGEVVSVMGQQVEVQLGHFRTTVPLSDVERRKKAAPETEQPQYNLPEVESPGMELDLRGQISSEALQNLEQYLDQAFLANLPWVRIIHGKGTGVLRQAVRRELNDHALVSTHRPGKRGEGGDGVTVVKLALG